MTLVALSILGIAAGAAFLWQILLRPKSRGWVVDFGSVGLMTGFAVLGVTYLVVEPNLDTSVPLVWYYLPHAYNLIIWPVLSLAVLRPRFGPNRFILAFVLVYGIDEIAWNALAYVRFDGGQTVLSFMATPYWLSFLAATLLGVGLCFYALRPKIIPNWTWLFLAAYVFVYVVLAGFPTFIDSVASPYVFLWEFMWQGAIWVFIYGTFWKGDSTNSSKLLWSVRSRS